MWVYGTLRPGQALNASWMSGSEHLSAMNVQGTLYYHKSRMYPLWVPEGNYVVKGDLFEMPTWDFRLLAGMEVQSGYTLVEIDGSGIAAFAWLRDDNRGEVIESGDWTNRNERASSTEASG